MRRLKRAELPVGTTALARFLIGKLLVSDHPDGRTSGRIVETEAYPPGDAAGHAFRGPTPRHQALYLERGHAYVYLAYGISLMCNVSSEAAGVGAGVLLRALEPLEGIALMEARRGTTRRLDLTRGPGRLAHGAGHRPRPERRRSLRRRPALARGRAAGKTGAHRPQPSDRHLAGDRAALAILRAREPFRQRTGAIARITGRPRPNSAAFHY